jgi:hypothetical protein
LTGMRSSLVPLAAALAAAIFLARPPDARAEVWLVMSRLVEPAVEDGDKEGGAPVDGDSDSDFWSNLPEYSYVLVRCDREGCVDVVEEEEKIRLIHSPGESPCAVVWDDTGWSVIDGACAFPPGDLAFLPRVPHRWVAAFRVGKHSVSLACGPSHGHSSGALEWSWWNGNKLRVGSVLDEKLCTMNVGYRGIVDFTGDGVRIHRGSQRPIEFRGRPAGPKPGKRVRGLKKPTAASDTELWGYYRSRRVPAKPTAALPYSWEVIPRGTWAGSSDGLLVIRPWSPEQWPSWLPDLQYRTERPKWLLRAPPLAPWGWMWLPDADPGRAVLVSSGYATWDIGIVSLRE